MPEMATYLLRTPLFLLLMAMVSVVGYALVANANSFATGKAIDEVAADVESVILRTYSSMAPGTATLAYRTPDVGFDYLVIVRYAAEGDAYTTEVEVRAVGEGRSTSIRLPKLYGYAASLGFERSKRILKLEVRRV